MVTAKKSTLDGAVIVAQLVGRAVASDTRRPWFESSHGQNKLY